MPPDVTSWDILFLSLLSNDETTYTGGWGSWMTAAGEWCVAHGYAVFVGDRYLITTQGRGLLAALEAGIPLTAISSPAVWS